MVDYRMRFREFVIATRNNNIFKNPREGLRFYFSGSDSVA
jgi:hypothetical protein